MVVPPGWNVTEPIGIAIKLYEIGEKLNHAPKSAKYFKSKIESLAGSLSSLEEVLLRIGDGRAARLPADNFVQLRKEINELHECIQRCEKFIGTFVPLTDDGSKKSSAAAKARWVWDEKKGHEHSAQIESHIHRINFNLNISTFAQAHTPQMDIPREPVPSRSDTLATLPPYTSPKQDGKQKDWDRQPKTPGSILGIPLEANLDEKSKNNAKKPWLPSPTLASPEFSPIFSSKRISGTLNLDESSGLSLDSPFTPSGTPSGTASSTSQSPFTPPDLLWRNGAERVRQDSVYSEFSLDSFSPQNLLEKLKDTWIILERKSREPSRKPVEIIEIFRNFETNQRCIKISPPRRFNIIYYLNCSSGRAVIPHIEHPEALDQNDGHQVRLEKIDFRWERLPSRKRSEASPRMDCLSPVASSAASIISTSTSASMKQDTRLRKEDRLVLEFGSSDHYRLFQEVVIGPDVELQAEIPAWEIFAKYRNIKNEFKESSMPCLRLWRRGRFQYLLFHANTSPWKPYKEFRMNHFELNEAGKTSIKLRVNLLDTARELMGLTRPIDTENLRNLDYLLINFEKDRDKAAFSTTATFDTF